MSIGAQHLIRPVVVWANARVERFGEPEPGMPSGHGFIGARKMPLTLKLVGPARAAHNIGVRDADSGSSAKALPIHLL